MSGPDERLDDELRRLAREAAALDRQSVRAEETEQALASVRSRIGDQPSRRTGRRHGGRRVLATAAVVVAIVAVAAVVMLTGDESGDRLASTPSLDDTSDVAISGPDPTPAPSVRVPATSINAPTTGPATTPTTVPDMPSTVVDRAGNELARFELVDGRVVNMAEPTDFAAALLDHLLHRSTVLGDSARERADRLVRGGLRIHTTLDPELQAAAEVARDQLPANETGIDAAIISVDTATGAIRAMVGGEPLEGDTDRINAALAPRATGSAVNLFVLAAGLQAGAQPDDVIDGRRGCTFPSTEPGEPDLQIPGGVAGYVGPLREIFPRSILCGSVRLSHAVGLDRMVATIYRLAESSYLFEGQSPDVRPPIRPTADLAVGVNELSPLDLASGMQSIANGGLHASPYYVDRIDDPNGNRWYTHDAAPTPVLDREAALQAIDVLRDTIRTGTARRHPLEAGRPAIGVTGTIQDNIDAWFVGATPELTTAVWVGDPTSSTPMIAIPEFVAAGINKVQGGTFPALIWKTYTDDALAGTPIEDWKAPPPPTRPNARLVVPGSECTLVGDDGSAAQPPAEELGTTVPPGVVDPTYPIPSVDPNLFDDGCR